MPIPAMLKSAYSRFSPRGNRPHPPSTFVPPNSSTATANAAASLVRTIASNYKLPYYTLSPTYSICKEHGYLAGEVKVCPHCGAKTEVYSRITGYYRPVQNWNDGKLQEYANRTEYDIGRSSLKRPTRSVVTLSNFAEDVEVKVEHFRLPYR